MPATISINHAPVLPLWAAVVAQRLGFRWDESLSLGKALAGPQRPVAQGTAAGNLQAARGFRHGGRF